MKIKIAAVIIVLSFVTCTKESSNQKASANSTDMAIAVTDTMDIPLNDLGAGTFYGYTGGLYPGGANKPSGSHGYDLNRICKLMVPIDTFGNPSSDGKIVFISLGGSTGGHNMRNLKAKTEGNPLTNPNLLLLNCDNGKKNCFLKQSNES